MTCKVPLAMHKRAFLPVVHILLCHKNDFKCPHTALRHVLWEAYEWDMNTSVLDRESLCLSRIQTATWSYARKNVAKCIVWGTMQVNNFETNPFLYFNWIFWQIYLLKWLTVELLIYMFKILWFLYHLWSHELKGLFKMILIQKIFSCLFIYIAYH